MKISQLLLCGVLVFALSGCSHRLVDFTVISTKNVDLGIDRTQGVRTEGKKAYVFAPYNLKDALDNALQNAGTEYDILIDGVVRYVQYPFVLRHKG